MKNVILFIVVAGVSSAVTYFVASPRGQDRKTAPQNANDRIDPTQSRRALGAAKARANRLEAELLAVNARLDETPSGEGLPAVSTPKEILDVLVTIKPTAKNRNLGYRKVIHHLETLADMGPRVVPTIAQFLKKNEDLDYKRLGGFELPVFAGGEASGLSSVIDAGMFGGLKTDFLMPPTLRLGLFQVLADIGDDTAQAALLEVLEETGRGIEVAMICRVLETLAPGRYRDQVLAIAKDILANPPAVDKTNALDRRTRSYLYSLLIKYRDETFVETAKTLMVSTEGKLDVQAMKYLNAILKERAIPLLMAAYRNETLTQKGAKSMLASTILRYTGQHPGADAFFLDLAEKKKLGQGHLFSLMNMGDKETIAKRKQLLAQIKDTLSEQQLAQATQIEKALDMMSKHNLEGSPESSTFSFSLEDLPEGILPFGIGPNDGEGSVIIESFGPTQQFPFPLPIPGEGGAVGGTTIRIESSTFKTLPRKGGDPKK